MPFQGAEVIASTSVSNLQAHVKIIPIFKSSIKELICVRMISVNSCIKAAAYVQFFNLLVRLLFKCGFHVRAAYVSMCKVWSLQNP